MAPQPPNFVTEYNCSNCYQQCIRVCILFVHNEQNRTTEKGSLDFETSARTNHQLTDCYYQFELLLRFFFFFGSGLWKILFHNHNEIIGTCN